MRTFKVDLPNSDIELIPLADLHLGDRLCDTNKIKSYIDYILATENAYCILNGDLINNAIKSSVSDTYGETLTPMEQLNRAVELFRPIAHKIICITNGNHEVRTYKSDGIDLMEIFARELGVANYSCESALLFIKISGDRTNTHPHHSKGHYVVFVNHGSGGGRTTGSAVNKLTNMANIVDADVYIHSHTHVPAIVRKGFYRTNATNRSATKCEHLFVNTSAFLNYGGYADAFEYEPTSKRTPIIKLHKDKLLAEAVA